MFRKDGDMFPTCMYASRMSTMIQLRHVPDDLHRKLKARAALAGMSLSDYLRVELEAGAERLTPSELRERLASVEPARVRERPSLAVRRGHGKCDAVALQR